MPLNVKERVPLTGNDIIIRYFKCIDNKDVDGALELFDYDAVVYEPFSNVEDGLKGRHSIEPFLKVAMMANSNFKRAIDIGQKQNKSDKVTALVTFERGDKTKARFTFEFTQEQTSNPKRIKSLRIEF
jgi:ketosteroid isomerase-like protein